MVQMREAVVVDLVRTPVGRGRATGVLAGEHPVDLLATTLRALVERTGIDPATIDDVVVGCVGQVGEHSPSTFRPRSWSGSAAHRSRRWRLRRRGSCRGSTTLWSQLGWSP